MNSDEGQVMWEIKIFIVSLDMILFSLLNATLPESHDFYDVNTCHLTRFVPTHRRIIIGTQ